MRHFRRHADGFPKGWVRVNRFADIHGIGTHFYRQGNLANHVARVGTDNAAAQNLAVAVRLGRIVKQQLGDAFVAAVGNGAVGCGPGEKNGLSLS